MNVEPITDERLEAVVLGALGQINIMDGSVDGITFSLRRLGVDVNTARVRALLDRLVDEDKLEHPESRTREGYLRAIIRNRYTIKGRKR